MIQIKYFGAVAEATQRTSENIENNGAGLQEILKELYSKYQIGQIPLKIAVNHKIVKTEEEISIKENDEIAVLPPFAGG